MVASCQEEVAGMKRVQAKCMQEQMRLDEESLERLKAQEEAKKVQICCKHLFPCNPWCACREPKWVMKWAQGSSPPRKMTPKILSRPPCGIHQSIQPKNTKNVADACLVVQRGLTLTAATLRSGV